MTKNNGKLRPDVLKAAVIAAGGADSVCRALNISVGRLYRRLRLRTWPAAEISKLSELGNGTVSIESILGYLVQCAADAKGAE